MLRRGLSDKGVFLLLFLLSTVYLLRIGRLSRDIAGFHDSVAGGGRRADDESRNFTSRAAALLGERSIPELPSLEAITRSRGEEGWRKQQQDSYRACESKRRFHFRENNRRDANDTIYQKYKIPLTIHQTSKSRCLFGPYQHTTNKWINLKHFDYYFHDDEAVDELITRQQHTFVDEFPNLDKVAKHCVNAGATKVDLWRLLLLYQYGGIYADIDSSPTANFTHETLRHDDDAFLLVDKDGFPSQYFMAVKPRHPVIRISLEIALDNMLRLNDTARYNPVRTTGPLIVRDAIHRYCADSRIPPSSPCPIDNHTGQVRQGVYRRTDGSTVRMVGTKDDSDSIIVRDNYKMRKEQYYKMMNMTHFSRAVKHLTGMTCLEAIEKKAVVQQLEWQSVE